LQGLSNNSCPDTFASRSHLHSDLSSDGCPNRTDDCTNIFSANRSANNGVICAYGGTYNWFTDNCFTDNSSADDCTNIFSANRSANNGAICAYDGTNNVCTINTCTDV
jgi:hypothetical protein